MHLWPSLRIRDSFKRSYIEKLEWNLHLMNRESQASDKTTQDPLLVPSQHKDTEKTSGLLVFCQELLFLFSCCFCCGACDDEVGN